MGPEVVFETEAMADQLARLIEIRLASRSRHGHHYRALARRIDDWTKASSPAVAIAQEISPGRFVLTLGGEVPLIIAEARRLGLTQA